MTDVNNTFGAAYIGLSASTFAFGILSAQVYTYFQRYPLDRPAYKLLVIGLLLLEALHTATSNHFFYISAISNWGNELVLVEKPIWSLVFQVIPGAMAGTIVKGCFAMRVWRFSKNNPWITTTLVISTVTQLGFSLWFTVAGFQLGSLAGLPSMFSIATVSLTLGAFTDIFTALTLCYYLRQLKSAYQRSNSMVNRLTIYAINTGLLTSTFSVACLICYDLMPRNFVFIGVYFVLSKLYANSFLAALNTRQVLKGRGTENDTEIAPALVMQLSRLRHLQDVHYSQGAKSDQHSAEFQVEVHHEVYSKFDHSPVIPGEGSHPLPHYGVV